MEQKICGRSGSNQNARYISGEVQLPVTHTLPDASADASHSHRLEPVAVDRALRAGDGDEGLSSARRARLVLNKRSASPDASAQDAAHDEKSYSNYALRDRLRQITNLRGLKICGAHGLPDKENGGTGDVTIMRSGETGRCHLRNVVTCSSIHACPICMIKIRRDRGTKARQAGEAVLAADDDTALFMITLTMKHSRGDSLARQIRVLRGVAKRLNSGKRSQLERERYGIKGYIRATEITVSDPSNPAGNGWHAHVHILLAVSKSADMSALRDAWYSVLVDEAMKEKLGKPSKKRGVDVRPVHDLPGLSRYVAKVCPEAWTAASELARLDRKAGHEGNLTPMQLAELVAAGDAEALALWHEYEHATKGLRAIQFSKRMQELAGEWATEEDVAAADEPATEEVATISSGTMELVAEEACTALLLAWAARDGSEGVRRACAEALKRRQARRTVNRGSPQGAAAA